MKSICICNQKGGISKTTSTSSLGFVLDKMGYKVLLIDLDSQASLSQLCQVYPADFTVEDEPVYGLQDVFEYAVEQEENHQPYNIEAIKAAIMRPQYREAVRVKNGDKFTTKFEYKDFGFDLIPADTELANYEQILSRRKDGGFILLRILRCIEENMDYDFVLMDAPPALTTLAYSGIAASTDGLIVPVNLEVLSLRGTKNIITATAEIQKYLQKAGVKHYGILGLLKNRYVKRYKVQQDFNDIIQEFFPVPSFETIIPAMTSVDKAHAKGWLFSQYDKKAFEIYKSLAQEIIAKTESQKGHEPVIIEEIGKGAEAILATGREVDDNE